jgi:hypothetical protein
MTSGIIYIFFKPEFMKQFKCILFCMLFVAGFSCRENNNPPDIPVSLNGTKWKLAGVVNVKTDILTEFEPRACTECFTLTFNSDHEASGLSVSSKIMIDLLDLRKYMNTGESEGSWGGYPSLPIDGDLFRKIMTSIESFTVTSEEIKLYFNKKTEYLLFKRDNTPTDVPASLSGTHWKLAGSVNAGGMLKEFAPKACVECFTLTFDTDSTASGISVVNQLRIHLLPKPAIVFMTEVDDTYNNDAQSYYDAWRTMISYKLENNDLWFLFNDKTESLLFRRIQP